MSWLDFYFGYQWIALDLSLLMIYYESRYVSEISTHGCVNV